MTFQNLKNLQVPEMPEVNNLNEKKFKYFYKTSYIIQIDDNPEFFLYKYVIRFHSINDDFNEESESSDFNKHLLHSMISSNLNI